MSNASKSWGDLPVVSLVTIFKHLKYKDRYNSSLVCRNWLSAFRSPVLWREMTFVFRKHRMLSDSKLALQFADRFSPAVKELVLIFESSSISCIYDLVAFFDQIAKFSSLRSLSVYNFLIHKNSTPILRGITVLNGFLRMVSAQKCLTKFRGVNSQFENQDAVFILRAVSRRNPYLTFLDITQFFHPDSVIYNHEEVLDCLSALSCLQTLKISYQSASEDLLRGLCTPTLQHLHITCHYSERLSRPPIPSAEWKRFRKRFLNVAVSFKIIEIAGFQDFCTFLPPFVPVTELEFRCGFTLRTEEHLQSSAVTLVEYLKEKFKKCLNKIEMDFGFSVIPNLESEVYELIVACESLSVVKISGAFTTILAQRLCVWALQEHTGLKDLHLRFHFSSFESIQELTLVRQYKDALIRSGINLSFNLLTP